ncbi:M16 family metallopeptidase [Aquisphaera insulae]|uniref:M16 family metallopeptidase n=1 Tax=Aquisphaera insulae TaxID=2712864 RepID=UPI0013EC73A5|nr:pitrilysin family protein [Aquisphaera insulae]
MQPPDLDYAKFTLENGLSVILRAQHGLPIVAVNLWYHVGSKNEERSQRGYAHLFEHLMFEGSQHYPGDFFKHLQRLGASINGSTSSDRTNYFVDIPRAHLETVLAMESDRMAHLVSALDENKLRIQKGVVKNEYRQNYANRPYGMVWPLIAEAMYPPQHPYSWMTIGVMEDLEAATLGDVSAFFGRYYVPANASLAVVGDIEPDAVLAQVERYFGSIPAGSKALTPWAPGAGLSEDRRLTLQDRVELDRLYLLWHTVPHFHPDEAALSLLGEILARGKSSRLYRKLVMDLQIAQDVTAYQSGRELAGAFGLTVTLRPSRTIDELRGLLDDEISAIAASGVDEEELARVLTMKTASFLFALEHLGGFGGVADRLNAYNVYRNDPSLITKDLLRFKDVQVADIGRVAGKYLAGKPRVSLSVVGHKNLTTSKSLDRSIPPVSAPPSAFLAPTPEILRLRNGIPVWVIPRRDLPTISVAVAMSGGAGLQPTGRSGLAQFAVSMLDEGTRTRSAAEIALAAEAMGTSLSASCGWDGAFVSFRSLAHLAEPSLELAADILREPSFPESEWDRLHGQTLAALRAERDSAESLAYRALIGALYDPAHPYHHPLDGSEESVAGLQRAEAIEFHRRALGPGRAGVIVAGDIDPEKALDLLERRLGDWTGPPVPLPEFPATRPAGRPRLLLLDRPGAAQAVIRAGHVGAARADADFESILLANQVLGGQFTSRLNEKLREEKGYTYGVRSHFDCRLAEGPFSVSTSVQSDKVADALDDIMHEIRAFVGDRPPTQVELDDARRSLIEGQTRHFETPAALVNRYANLFIYSLPSDHYRGFAARLEAVDCAALASAASRRIHPDSLVVVVVADASQVEDSLRGLGWADLERVGG